MHTTLTLDNDIAVRLNRLSHLRNENFEQTANEALQTGLNIISAVYYFEKKVKECGLSKTATVEKFAPTGMM